MMRSFIEVQFPVAKVSLESYKERKSVQFQTLTQLGKWWGRKPLIIVRSAIFGLLLPATDNPKKDREIFLKLVGMDEKSRWKRKNKSISANELIKHLTKPEIDEYCTGNPPVFKRLSRSERESLQKKIFFRLNYLEQLKYCCRPEQCDTLDGQDWKEINDYLGTSASSYPSLIKELSTRYFGTSPTFGDCFCGGGNIPFEAARLGFDVYASDLSPIATLLTWGAFNIVGGGDKVVQEIKHFQESVFDQFEEQIKKWGVEENDAGWRAYAYAYCIETTCPECGWKVPLLPSRVIAERMERIIAELVPKIEEKRYDIHIRTGVSEKELNQAKDSGTIINRGGGTYFKCPNINCIAHTAPIGSDAIRREGTQGLRHWDKNDFTPRSADIFQERLYCIRWEEIDSDGNSNWHFLAPTDHDLTNEGKIISLLKERWDLWRSKGYIPSNEIEPGDETSRLYREKGWKYWHQLWSPRQLLYHGQLLHIGLEKSKDISHCVSVLLGLGQCLDWNSKLTPWHPGVDLPQNTFYNRSLNTMFVYGGRGSRLLKQSWTLGIEGSEISGSSLVENIDGRLITKQCLFWITDPPYADAINYHELSEYFLAWYSPHITKIFPRWVPDSRRPLAIKGADEDFRKGMVEVYSTLSNRMPDNGMQIVMFTHQDTGVWADLALILWASGLRVTSAWCVGTETNTAIRQGNYVQGTALLILRKQTDNNVAFLDEVYPAIEDEVRRQLDEMTSLDDKEDPSFSDTDYQLAAYAAALRILTGYKKIEEIDVSRELSRSRVGNEETKLEQVIRSAVIIACDHLVPSGIERYLWKQLTAEERFFLKGLEIESHGEVRSGAFQELARGFGIREYRPYLASSRANQTRLKTASEFRPGDGADSFADTRVRRVLIAIRQTVAEGRTEAGRVWLRSELGPRYWDMRQDLIAILKYLHALSHASSMAHWKDDAEAAHLLAVAIEQDHV